MVIDNNYTIEKANNGFIVNRSWKEVSEPKDPYNYNYNNEKNIFSNWEDVCKYLVDNALI